MLNHAQPTAGRMRAAWALKRLLYQSHIAEHPVKLARLDASEAEAGGADTAATRISGELRRAAKTERRLMS